MIGRRELDPSGVDRHRVREVEIGRARARRAPRAAAPGPVRGAGAAGRHTFLASARAALVEPRKRRARRRAPGTDARGRSRMLRAADRGRPPSPSRTAADAAARWIASSTNVANRVRGIERASVAQARPSLQPRGAAVLLSSAARARSIRGVRMAKKKSKKNKSSKKARRPVRRYDARRAHARRPRRPRRRSESPPPPDRATRTRPCARAPSRSRRGCCADGARGTLDRARAGHRGRGRGPAVRTRSEEPRELRGRAHARRPERLDHRGGRDERRGQRCGAARRPRERDDGLGARHRQAGEGRDGEERRLFDPSGPRQGRKDRALGREPGSLSSRAATSRR